MPSTEQGNLGANEGHGITDMGIGASDSLLRAGLEARDSS